MPFIVGAIIILGGTLLPGAVAIFVAYKIYCDGEKAVAAWFCVVSLVLVCAAVWIIASHHSFAG